ncbi:MAG: YqgE/AlgH family protein [Dehalococcoidia bacterium]
MENSTAGKLLIATPKLVDPNFARTVVYMAVHDENGALGVILNRPIREVSAAEHLPAWAEFLAAPTVMFQGGPVEPIAAIGLGRWLPDSADEGGETVGIVNLNDGPEAVPGTLRTLRVFLGYAGWGAEQLEGEIAEGAWFVVDALPDDPFREEVESLWRDVLRRQHNQLAMFAWYPVNPSLN